MKIAVIGAGSIGSVYAGLLAEAGNAVTAIDTWEDHIAAIRAHGLRLEGPDNDRRVALPAATEVRDIGVCDMVIIATKARHVHDAAEAADPLIGPETAILTIQNGVGSAERIAAAVDRGHILVGVAEGFGASLLGPGHALYVGRHPVMRLGASGGPPAAALDAVARAWRDAGVEAKIFDDIDRLIWEKLICNVTYSGVCTLSEKSFGGVQASPDLWPVAAACASECYAVARAKGIALPFDDPVAYVRDYGATLPEAISSVRKDHMKRRRSEIDVLNGAICRLGCESGVPTPVNDTIVALIKAREEDFT